MKINDGKKINLDPLWTPFAPNFGLVLVPLAPLPEDTFRAKNRKLIILTIFATIILKLIVKLENDFEI